MEQFPLTEILDLGLSGVLLFMLWQLWNRFTALTDRLFVYLEEAKQDRHNLRAQITASNLAQQDRDQNRRP